MRILVRLMQVMMSIPIPPMIKEQEEIKNDEWNSKQTEYFVIFVKTPRKPGYKHNLKNKLLWK